MDGYEDALMIELFAIYRCVCELDCKDAIDPIMNRDQQ